MELTSLLACFVALGLLSKTPASAAGLTESPSNQVNIMNALDLLSANVLNFVIYVVTLFGKVVSVMRVLY